MLTEEKICRLQGFIVNEMPTLAGIMLFSDYPQAFFPQLCITAVSISGTEISMTDDTGGAANCLDDDELELAAAVFTQIGEVLAVIAVQRSICSKNKKTGTT